MKKQTGKNFSDNTLLILEKQKQDEVFTKYVRNVLMERYTENTTNIDTLTKKFRPNNPFQTDILWDAISLKLMTSSIIDLGKAYTLIDNMPIDYVIRISQNAMQEPLRQQASSVFYEKQEELERELELDLIDYEKYEEDEVVVNEFIKVK